MEHIETKSQFTFVLVTDHEMEWHVRFAGIANISNVPYDNRLRSVFSFAIHSQINSKQLRFKLFSG